MSYTTLERYNVRMLRIRTNQFNTMEGYMDKLQSIHRGDV